MSSIIFASPPRRTKAKSNTASLASSCRACPRISTRLKMLAASGWRFKLLTVLVDRDSRLRIVHETFLCVIMISNPITEVVEQAR